MTANRKLARALVTIVGLAFAALAGAQAWPAKPVQIIAPTNVGSGPDLLARILGAKLAERWGQQVVIVNKLGAGTMIGTAEVAKSLALIEGGLIFGTSMALKERITFSKGRVEQTSFDDYPILRMNEAPDLRVELVPSDGPPTGLGEISPIVAPAAIGNAFAALTGRRVRHLPLLPERVLAALA